MVGDRGRMQCIWTSLDELLLCRCDENTKEGSDILPAETTNMRGLAEVAGTQSQKVLLVQGRKG